MFKSEYTFYSDITCTLLPTSAGITGVMIKKGKISVAYISEFISRMDARTITFRRLMNIK